MLVSYAVFLSAGVALGKGGTDWAPSAQSGAHFFTGDDGKSLTGQMGYSILFAAEQKKGALKPSFGFNFDYSKGTASIGSDSPAYSMFGAGFMGGLNLFFVQSGRIRPFLGGGGILAWHFLKMEAPPAGIQSSTESLSYGYEIRAGVDLRFGSSEGRALRIQSAVWNVQSSLAAQPGFLLNGFRILVGLLL